MSRHASRKNSPRSCHSSEPPPERMTRGCHVDESHAGSPLFQEPAACTRRSARNDQLVRITKSRPTPERSSIPHKATIDPVITPPCVVPRRWATPNVYRRQARSSRCAPYHANHTVKLQIIGASIVPVSSSKRVPRSPVEFYRRGMPSPLRNLTLPSCLGSARRRCVRSEPWPRSRQQSRAPIPALSARLFALRQICDYLILISPRKTCEAGKRWAAALKPLYGGHPRACPVEAAIVLIMSGPLTIAARLAVPLAHGRLHTPIG